MGTIPQYQRDRFASTIVGGAQRDDSAALVAGAVQDNLIEPIRRDAVTRLKEHNDAINDLQANNAIVDYSLSAQKQLEELQKAHASDPDRYPDAVNQFMQESSDVFAKNIGNEKVRQKFITAASSLSKQAIAPAIAWRQAQQEANAATAVENTARTIALTAGQSTTPEALKQNLAALRETVGVLAKDVTNPAFNKKMLDTYGPKAVEAQLANRVQSNPQALIDDLNTGKYDDIPEYNSALKAEYVSKAESKIRSDLVEINRVQRENAGNAAMEIMAGKGSFEKIDAMADAPNPYQRISTADAENLKSALVRQVRADATTLGKKDPKAFAYLDLIDKYVDDKLDSAKLAQAVTRAYADETISPQEGLFLTRLNTNLYDMKVAKERQDINQVLGQTKAFLTNITRGSAWNAIGGVFNPPKVDNETTVRNHLRSMIHDMANGATPNEAMQTVMTRALRDKLRITDTTHIPKDGKVYKGKSGVKIRVFRATDNGKSTVSFTRESP